MTVLRCNFSCCDRMQSREHASLDIFINVGVCRTNLLNGTISNQHWSIKGQRLHRKITMFGRRLIWTDTVNDCHVEFNLLCWCSACIECDRHNHRGEDFSKIHFSKSPTWQRLKGCGGWSDRYDRDERFMLTTAIAVLSPNLYIPQALFFNKC